MRWRICAMQIAVAAAGLLIGTAAARAGTTTLQGCCLPDSSCVDVPGPTECAAQGGVLQPGLTCNGESCGGCCGVGEQTLECTLALAANCTAQQRRGFKGSGTNCDDGCPFCCSCTGDQGCTAPCVENPSTCSCRFECVAHLSLFDDCQNGCETTGCCDLGDVGNVDFCAATNEAACALVGTFHPGEECTPGLGCGPRLCCHCEGDPDVCGGDACQEPCTRLACNPFECTGVVTTGTCADGCEPTGCCQYPSLAICVASDADACDVIGGTFVLGGTCDPPTGQCSGGPTATATSTPTATATETATTTPVPTSTRVPEGGACQESFQCAPALICLDGICAAANAPAPATSRLGLVLAFAVLLAIAALALRRRTASRR